MQEREGAGKQDRIGTLGGLWLVVAARGGGGGQRPRAEFLAVGQSRAVGSGRAADIVVADRFMSRMHFGVRWLGHGPTVEDLGSTNGTTVNGIQVAGRLCVSAPALIRAGMSEFSLFPAVATERGRAAEFGRLLGIGEDTAVLFHELFAASMRQGPMARLAAWYVGLLLDEGGGGEGARAAFPVLSPLRHALSCGQPSSLPVLTPAPSTGTGTS